MRCIKHHWTYERQNAQSTGRLKNNRTSNNNVHVVQHTLTATSIPSRLPLELVPLYPYKIHSMTNARQCIGLRVGHGLDPPMDCNESDDCDSVLFFLYHFDINRKECAVCLIGTHCSTVDYKS